MTEQEEITFRRAEHTLNDPPEDDALQCCDCGKLIRRGDEFYDVYGDYLCERCMQDRYLNIND